MKTEADLAEATLLLLAPDWRRFARTFYERLFARRPDVRALFKRPPDVRESHFFAALQVLAGALRSAEDLENLVTALAGTHIAYGVRAEDFVVFGEVLMEVLAEACGSEWTPEREDAWREAYARIEASAGRALERAFASGGAEPPVCEPSEAGEDILEVASEYLAMNRRWRGSDEPLSLAELKRWRNLRRMLETVLSPRASTVRSRRRSLRVPTVMLVDIGSPGAAGRTVVTEISQGGLFVATQREIDCGSRMTIEFLCGRDSQRVRVHGTVVWRRPPSGAAPGEPAGYGIRLDPLEPAQAAALEAFFEEALLVTLSRCDDASDLDVPPSGPKRSSLG